MAELQIDFRGSEEWIQWASENRNSFDHWRESSLNEIYIKGIDEPISNNKRSPDDLLINIDNLRESISSNGLNSIRRAGLFCLELCLDAMSEEQRNAPRIISTEALSTAARILSSKFPYFIGTENFRTRQQQEQHFPIRNFDIRKIDIPSNSFDIFYSTDELELVPDLKKCLGDIFAILKPGGMLVSTFPFMHNKPENQVRAVLGEDGEIQNLCPPQYSKSRINSETFPLVFTKIGWEILEIAKKAGFADAKFTYIISSRYGILNNSNPGMFVFCATKSQQGESNKFLRTKHISGDKDGVVSPSKLVGLIGFPRSGTTMLASIFSAHPNINCVYEPWNSNKRLFIDNVNIDTFFRVFAAGYEKDKEVLLVKETSTNPVYIRRMRRLMDSVKSNDQAKFIVLFRNPFHIYLSEVEARVKWWGAADVDISTKTFDAWALRSVRSAFRMLLLAERYDGLLVSYEYLTENHKVSIGKLMDYAGLPLDQKQLDFHLHINTSKVRGDPKLKEAPTSVDSARQTVRHAELQQIEHLISDSKYYSDICLLRDYVKKLTNFGPVRYQDQKFSMGIARAPYLPFL